MSIVRLRSASLSYVRLSSASVSNVRARGCYTGKQQTSGSAAARCCNMVAMLVTRCLYSAPPSETVSSPRKYTSGAFTHTEPCQYHIGTCVIQKAMWRQRCLHAHRDLSVPHRNVRHTKGYVEAAFDLDAKGCQILLRTGPSRTRSPVSTTSGCVSSKVLCGCGVRLVALPRVSRFCRWQAHAKGPLLDALLKFQMFGRMPRGSWRCLEGCPAEIADVGKDVPRLRSHLRYPQASRTQLQTVCLAA